MKKEKMKWIGYGVVLSVETCAMLFITSLAGCAAKESFKKAFKKEVK